MPHRDPNTGQFTADAPFTYNDLEILRWDQEFSVSAADLTGATAESYGNSFSLDGYKLRDMENIVDRDELATLVMQEVRIAVPPFGSQTADGLARGVLELSTSPVQQAIDFTGDYVDTSQAQIAESTAGGRVSDSHDIIGRPLVAMAGSVFSDGATGVGGAGPASTDEHSAVWGLAGPVLDARDDLFFNLEIEAQNIADSAAKLETQGALYFLPERRSRG